MRQARHKSTEATFYHLCNRTAGDPLYFPFDNPEAAGHFTSLLELYLRLYFCRLASFQLMGNHYHLVLYFQKYRRLSQQTLHTRARLRFGRRWQLKTRHWDKSRWRQFNRDLFDVSCFMQHLNGEFAKWYNARFQRRGHFWAGRFKSTQLLDAQAVQNALLYTELNAVRAGRTRRPEQDPWGSAHWRYRNQKAGLLIPIQELFAADNPTEAYRLYRQLLYHCGAIDSPDQQAPHPRALLPTGQGIFAKRRRFFTDGLAVGASRPIRHLLDDYRKQGLYKRRQHPVAQLDGLCFTLREQRSHAFSPQ